MDASLMSAGKGAALQVRVEASQLAAFRAYAEMRGTTMSALVLGWIRAAVAGVDADLPVSTAAVVNPQVGETSESRFFLADLLSEAKVQTALLQRLVEREAAATPGGGTRDTRGDQPAREVVRPKLERFEPQDLGPGLAQSDPAAAVEPPVPVVGPALGSWRKPAPPFTEEEAEALAPCKARNLLNEASYKSMPSEDVEILLDSGFVARGKATGQANDWVEVKPGDHWPDGGRRALNIAAPITAVSWPSRVSAVQDNNNQEHANAVG